MIWMVKVFYGSMACLAAQSDRLNGSMAKGVIFLLKA